MAVTSGLTTFETFEAPGASFTNIGSGGGAADNTDVFIQGIQSGGRRVDNATDKGFMANVTAVDLSGANEHAKVWVFCFHWSAVTALTARIASGTSAYDNHVFPAADIPTTGGWIPLWFDVSRTPDSTGTSGCNEASVTDIGAYIDIGNVGGAGDNWIIDEIHYGSDGLTWSGSSGDMADFRTFEDTNTEGNLVPRDGVDFVYSRLTIGDSAATTFTDSAFAIVFPDQVLVSSTFMGLTIDLQNASTAVDISNASIASGNATGATNRPDLLVTGSSGTLDIDTCTLNGLRTIELNGSCTLTNSVILNTGLVDATGAAASSGADLSGSTIADSTVAADASSLRWDSSTDPNGELDNMTFTKGTNAHHAIEFGTTSPTNITLTGCVFNGFNASNAQNDSTFYVARTTGDVTINISGGSGNVSYKSAGANVSIVQNPVTLTVSVTDLGGTALSGARAIVRPLDGTGPLPYQDSVTITRSGSTASVSHTAHGLSNGQRVEIRGADQAEYNGVFTISNSTTNAYDYTVSGTPTTPATGTITSTAVIIFGTTDVNGEISDTRTYSTDQPISGWVRLSSVSPYYRESPVIGTIDSSNGLTAAVPLVSDE